MSRGRNVRKRRIRAQRTAIDERSMELRTTCLAFGPAYGHIPVFEVDWSDAEVSTSTCRHCAQDIRRSLAAGPYQGVWVSRPYRIAVPLP